jgi:ribosome-associated toxin RatA of RatAB toxin-antitoxin module
MKRIILTCCLFAASTAAVFAQHVVNAVAKPNFVAEVNRMDKFIAGGNMAQATNVWNELKKLMTDEMAVTKMHISEARTEAERTTSKSKIDIQREAYSQAFNLATKDLKANQSAIDEKLAAFANTLL